MKKGKLTKEQLLEVTENGWLYFLKVFPELKNVKPRNGKVRPIRNHLRGEKRASLSFYLRNGNWFAKDFGDPDFYGDMFKVYAIINRIDDIKANFVKIMRGIYKEVMGEDPPDEDPPFTNFEEVNLPEGVDFELEIMPFDALETEETAFLKNFRIDREKMEENQSVFLRSYSFIANDGRHWKFKKCKGDVIIAHRKENSAKIYKPYQDQYKFQWLGEKPNEYIFGDHQLKELYRLIENNQFTEDSLQLVCCAGEKDALVLQSLGVRAICLNSEVTTYFPATLLCYILDIRDAIAEKFELVILYDKDETGVKSAQKIKEYQSKHEYQIRIINLPDALVEKGGKDVADYISLGFPTDELLRIIKGSELSAVSPISPPDEKNEEEPDASSIDTQVSEVFKLDHQSLPETLKECLEPFKDELKYMMLFSFITSIGSIMHNVVGRFRRDKIYPNLYTVIVAPPASGKSLMKWARQIILPIDQKLIEKSKLERQQYQMDKELVALGKMDKSELGPEPPYQVQIIPCDITSAAWIQQVCENDGYGLMFDTEIDGLVESNSGSLRSFSDYLRKAYEGEPLSVMRKKDREHIMVEEGKLSLLISGTPRQFFKLIPDAENGLYSRIIPFKFNGKNTWISVLNSEEIDLDEFFEPISQRLLGYFTELNRLPGPITFELTDEQKLTLDRFFDARVEMVKSIAGFDGRASVLRLGAITIKIAMILATLRRLDENSIHNRYASNSRDFENSLAMADIILQNGFELLRLMNEERVENLYRGNKLDYFYALPEVFTYGESQAIAEEMGLKPRTAEKWLYGFRNRGLLINPTKGSFRKVGQSITALSVDKNLA